MGPWHRADPDEVALANARIAELDAKRRLEETHAGIGLKITAPVLTFSGKWEATWGPDGFALADTYAEIRDVVHAALPGGTARTQPKDC